MGRSLLLGLALAAIWLLMSGYFDDVKLLSFGAAFNSAARRETNLRRLARHDFFRYSASPFFRGPLTG